MFINESSSVAVDFPSIDVLNEGCSFEIIAECGEGKQVYVEVGNTSDVLCEWDKTCVQFTVTIDGSSVTLTNALSKTSLSINNRTIDIEI